MIYTDIKQAIGSILVDVKEYSIHGFNWEIFIFNSGICIIQEEWDYDGPEKTYSNDFTERMPEELKELIKQYK